MKRTAILLFLLTLLPAAAFAQSYSAILTGAAEVPNAGDPDGAGLAVVTIAGTTIQYTVFHQNVGAPTLAHIHRGAAGVAGPVVVDFNVNTFVNGQATSVAQSLIDEIRANPSGFYVNVHTSEFPGGAIRGQLAAPSGGDASRVVYIPVVGKVAGANNTNFVTDIRIVNPTGTTANVTLDFFAANPAGQSGPNATKAITVLPGEQKVLDDAVGATLGVASGLGGLKVTSDQDVVVTARVINDLRAQSLGTAGFALGAEEGGKTSGTLTFLAASSDYRTNIGYFNPGSGTANATFVARRASDGAILGTRTIAIPALSMVQQPAFGLINTVPAGDQTQNDFYVTWSSDAPLFVYGAVTDNRTGDAVLNQ